MWMHMSTNNGKGEWNMKKLLALLLVLAIAITFMACTAETEPATPDLLQILHQEFSSYP